MKNFGSIRRYSIKSRRTPPGSAPGSVIIAEDAIKPLVNIFAYNKEGCHEESVSSMEGIKRSFEAKKDCVHWISINGHGDKQLLEAVSAYFSIHRLELEDVVNTYQRPKVEEYEHHLFIVSRVIYMDKEGLLRNEQVSLFLGKNYVLTIHEAHKDVFDPVRERIRQSKGNFLQHGPDYLAYAIIDTVIDNYFPVLESMGDKLDDLEEELLIEPARASLNKIQRMKHELIMLRRALWPERDKINELVRGGISFVSSNTQMFLRDSYDHCIQLLDIIESNKEITASMMDIYLSSVSNRMNQIMKVLTVISTIFIPLTFIVGVYGMNFSRINPETGKAMPYSMPELYSPYGYVGVLIVMVLIVAIQLVIFYKKGWLGKS